MQREKLNVRSTRSPRRATALEAAQEAVETAEREAEAATRKKDGGGTARARNRRRARGGEGSHPSRASRVPDGVRP